MKRSEISWPRDFDELYDEYMPQLADWLQSRNDMLCREGAEDLAKDIFADACLSSYVPDAKFFTWIISIAKRKLWDIAYEKKRASDSVTDCECVGRCKCDAVEREVDDEDELGEIGFMEDYYTFITSGEDAPEPHEQKELLREFHKAARKIKCPDEKRVLQCMIDGMSIRETSMETGIDFERIKYLRDKIRDFLRSSLGETYTEFFYT